MNIVNGTCIDCGCADNECECLMREKAAAADKVEEFCLAIERKLKPLADGEEGVQHKPSTCFDCHSYADNYMVDGGVWVDAWPTYVRDRSMILERYKTMYPQFHERGPRGVLRAKRGRSTGGYLCLRCLENRLGRCLLIKDFTKAPINEPIRFAFMMGVDSARAEVRRKAKEIADCVSQHRQRH